MVQISLCISCLGIYVVFFWIRLSWHILQIWEFFSLYFFKYFFHFSFFFFFWDYNDMNLRSFVIIPQASKTLLILFYFFLFIFSIIFFSILLSYFIFLAYFMCFQTGWFLWFCFQVNWVVPLFSVFCTWAYPFAF